LVILVCIRLSKTQPSVLIMVPIALLVGFLTFRTLKRFSLSLLDQVIDCGDHLLLKRGKLEDTVPFSDIAEVIFVPNSCWPLNKIKGTPISSPRVCLKFKTPNHFETTAIFVPALDLSLNPLRSLHRFAEKVNEVSIDPIILTCKKGIG
jgi:hypothetical protein